MEDDSWLSSWCRYPSPAGGRFRLVGLRGRQRDPQRREAGAYGTSDLQHDASEQLPLYQNPTSPQRMILALDRGACVGRARSELESIGDTAWVKVEVLVEQRARGIGRALADQVSSRP